MNTVIAFACLAFVASVLADTPCKSTHSCKLESLGCFRDKKSKRVMPKLIEYDRSIENTKYENLIDWKRFGSYVKDLGCRCAKRAAEKGFNVIGLQFYGECWSGPDGEKTYDDYGPGECVNGKFESSKEFDCSETHVGTQWSNEVYRIATPGCSEKFEPIGCYNDDLKNPRPLPNYILNERDPTHKSWNGKTIDWKRWKTYVPGLICRCAKKAKENKHTYFAIQHWGECWSGNEDEVNYARNGVSKNCRNEYFKKCSCNSYLCVGMEAANYVYKFRDDAQCGS